MMDCPKELENECVVYNVDGCNIKFYVNRIEVDAGDQKYVFNHKREPVRRLRKILSKCSILNSWSNFSINSRKRARKLSEMI